MDTKGLFSHIDENSYEFSRILNDLFERGMVIYPLRMEIQNV